MNMKELPFHFALGVILYFWGVPVIWMILMYTLVTRGNVASIGSSTIGWLISSWVDRGDFKTRV